MGKGHGREVNQYNWKRVILLNDRQTFMTLRALSAVFVAIEAAAWSGSQR
jgi:hypothetical protein